MGIAAAGIFSIGGDMPVHRIGFGAMRLVGPEVWGESENPANAQAVLRRAVELGVDFIDTAEVYGPNVNERQIAEALQPYPKGLVIATKCGLRRYRAEGDNSIRFRLLNGRDDLRTSIAGSLDRLGLDRIDLYQLHAHDKKLPIETVMESFAELRDEKRVRHVGLSNVSLEELERARTILPVATVQNRYNVGDREHDAVLDYCAANGIGFMPWFPIGGADSKLADADGPLAPIAKRHGAMPSQVALAWLLARSPVILPIPGTASIAHLEQNVAAADLVLTDADMTELERLGTKAG